MSTELSAARRREALKDRTERFVQLALTVDGGASVPTCPNWTVADLVEHVGQTQHWVSEIVERRVTDPSELPAEMVALPADRAAWPAWFAESAARAVTACSDEALGEAAFNPAGDERTGTQFWLSSLLNEAVVHGADAAGVDGEPYDLDADVAAGLVTNHLKMLTSPGWAANVPDSVAALRGSGETLHWRATDEPSLGEAGEWFIERGPEGARWRHGPGTADVSVQGPARLLLLVLTRRIPLTEEGVNGLSIDGDVDLVRHWVQHTAHDAG